MAGSGSWLVASGVTCASSDFLAREDKKVAAELRVVSGDSPPLFGWLVPPWCRVVELCMAAAAFAMLFAALAAYPAARLSCLLFTYLENSHLVAYFSAS